MTQSDSQTEHRLQEARNLLAAGRVLEVRVLQGGQVVTGVITAPGEARARGGVHRVYIRRSPPNGFLGECSCGSELCAHVLAVSLAAEGAAPTPEAPRTTSGVRGVSDALAPAQCLHYVLEAPARRDTLDWQVSLWVAQTPGLPTQRFVPRMGGEYPRYVDAQDRRILQGLTGQQPTGPWPLRGRSGAQLLELILQTGRARLGHVEAPALRAAPPRRMTLLWQADEDGMQSLACESGCALILGIEPPAWVDGAAGEAGTLELPWIARVRACWPQSLAPEEVEALRAELSQDPASHDFPRPASLPVRAEPLASLAGRLRLTAQAGYAWQGTRPALALVSLLYNGRPVRLTRLSPTMTHVRVLSAEAVLEVPRDLAAEAGLRAQVEPWLPSVQGERAWLRLLLQGAPALRAQGWEVQVAADFPYPVVEADEWYAEVHPQRREWFDLKLGVRVGSQEINLLPALTRYLETSLRMQAQSGEAVEVWEGPEERGPEGVCGRMGEHWVLRLADGRYLALPLARITRIADTLVELFERTSLGNRGTLGLPQAQAPRLAQLAHELGGLTMQGEGLSTWLTPQVLQQLTQPAAAAAPADFPTTLRPYQENGLGWLQQLRTHALGGLLADDMGLGKTVQTLAHLAVERRAGRLQEPVLIVAPVSALVTWEREIRRFLPDLRWVLWHGSRRKESGTRGMPALADAEVILTGYPLLVLDSEILLARTYSLVILDEAQAIKNPDARVSVTARALQARHRLCLTGTPVENHLGELWSLFEFLQPGLLGSEPAFQRHYRTPIEKNGSLARSRALSERVAPFLLRRTKESVALDLPPKTEILQSIELDERQRDFYDSIRLAMHQRVREVIQQAGIIRSQITILDALLKLRQACCDPRLVTLPGGAPAEPGRVGETEGLALEAGPAGAPPAPVQDAPVPEAIPSAKLEWLAQALPQLVAEGRRILLFSQFTSMLDLIREQLHALELPYCLLTGETRNRAAEVERFQAGQVPLFLISLKAGGTALNLTAADTVIHYDPWWNPAVEAQATDRAYRIGQDKPVFVYKLIAAGTVEDRILDLQSRKQALASQVYDPHPGEGGGLTETELEALFAP